MKNEKKILDKIREKMRKHYIRILSKDRVI